VIPLIEPIRTHDPRLDSAKTLTTVVYGLCAASFLARLTAIAVIRINHVKLPQVEGSCLANHFRWHIRTFWFGLP